MGVKENPSGGFVVEALKLMPLLPQSVQEQYEQLVCDNDLQDAHELLNEHWPGNLPPVEEIFLFGPDDTPDDTLAREVPYARFDESDLFIPRESTDAHRALNAHGIEVTEATWTMFG